MRTLLICLLLLLSSVMTAQVPRIPSRDGLYLVRRLSEREESGLVRVTNDNKTVWIEVGPRASLAWARLRSETSANNQYSVVFAYACSGTSTDSILRVDGRWQFVKTDGGSAESCTASIDHDVSRSVALRLARIMDTKLLQWQARGERVRGTFAAAKPVFMRGEDTEIIFTMVNPADAPSVIRESAVPSWTWSFDIERDGVPVHSFVPGGSNWTSPDTLVKFAPGETVVLRAILRYWSNDASAPGHYVVKCSHSQHFERAGTPAKETYKTAGGNQSFSGTVEFDIR